jgi:hypothetical protein
VRPVPLGYLKWKAQKISAPLAPALALAISPLPRPVGESLDWSAYEPVTLEDIETAKREEDW